MLMDTQESVTFLLHDLARQFRYRFDARAKNIGVTRTQWRALFHLARREGQTQSELAEMLEVERITLCRMVDRLAEADLVERRADPDDRRVWRLHLTARAHAIVGQLTSMATDLEDEVLSALEPGERTILRETLTRLRQGFNRGAADDKTGGVAKGNEA